MADYKPYKKNKMVRLLILVLILAVLFFVGFKSYLSYLKSPVDKQAKIQAFVIQKGESIDSIAKRLEEEKIIRSAFAFKLELKTNRNIDYVEAGDFKLSGAMSLGEVMKELSKGAVDKWVTLLEGWRVEETAARLNKELGIDEKEFLKYAEEGYMFPDTYLFNKEASAQMIASTLRNTFDQRYTNELQAKIKAKGLTPEQGVILASLVEREARSDKIRTEVAGIILKRLKIGMKLDIDSTVQYAKDTQSYKAGSLKSFWQPITQADYSDVKSPYNTYLAPGLPPEPIANPSLSSLKAVANANPNTPYLYYYHDSKGNTYYARTLDEHNENVANYR